MRVKEWYEWIEGGCERSLSAQREKGKNKETQPYLRTVGIAWPKQTYHVAPV